MNLGHRPKTVGLAIVATLAVAIPSAAFADSIGPHSSYYSTVSLKNTKPVPSSVNVDVKRSTGVALVNASNACLGTFTFSVPNQPAVKGSKSATATTRVRHGRISFNGRARLISGQGVAGSVRMTFRASVTARRATGTVTFPGTKCRRMSFVAPLRIHTK